LKVVCENQRNRPKKSEVEILHGCNKKIMKNTNWKQQYSLEEGLKETIEWFGNKDNLKLYKSNIYNV
jgi:nucleoside-diphosphate-sugar epimerase